LRYFSRMGLVRSSVGKVGLAGEEEGVSLVRTGSAEGVSLEMTRPLVGFFCESFDEALRRAAQGSEVEGTHRERGWKAASAIEC
jgi:hypothetical protein